MRTVTILRSIFYLSGVLLFMHPLIVIYSPMSLYSYVNNHSQLANLLIFATVSSLLQEVWTYLLTHGHFFRYRIAPCRDFIRASKDLRICDNKTAEDYRFRDVLGACAMTSGILLIDLLWLWFYCIRHIWSSLLVYLYEFDDAALQFAVLMAHGTVAMYCSLFAFAGYHAIIVVRDHIVGIGDEAGVVTKFPFLRSEAREKED